MEATIYMQTVGIYLPIMSNPCWGPRHMHVNRARN